MTRHDERMQRGPAALTVVVNGARLFAMAISFAACASQGASGASAAQPKSEHGAMTLLVDPSIGNDGDQVRMAWMAYGLAKLAAYQKEPPSAANASADDFATELAGREMLARFWSDQRKDGAPAFASFDQQVDIWRAGYLPELVVVVHGRPGWTVPPAALAKLHFDAVAQKFSGNYAQGAPVQVKSNSGKPFPDVPGADFPDPASLPMGAPSCTRALDERNAAWSRFEALEKQLGGVPVSAMTTFDFAQQLMAAQGEDAHRTRGATWVSPRVGYLAKLDAFCAVEQKDWTEAMRTLSRAIAIRPGDAGLRLEFALALTARNKPDEALAQTTRAMALTRDGCTMGLAWRRRGYILVETGALEAAQAAYQTSLKFDAKNRIAHSELATIAKMRKERRSRTPEPAVTSVPPFGMTLTECGARPAE